MRRAPVFAAPLLAVAVLAGGCGSGAKQAQSCGQLAGAGTSQRSGVGGQEAAYLTGVRTESDECIDRVTFDFRAGGGGRPGYRVQYLPAGRALVEDGSGRRIAAEGSAFLVVRFEPAATAETSGDQLVLTYTGPRRLRLTAGRHAKEVVKTGDFEAVVTWVISVSEKRPFRTVASTSPPRLVVELG